MSRGVLFAALMTLALAARGWAQGGCGGCGAGHADHGAAGAPNALAATTEAEPGDRPAPKPQTVCPVMGGKIDRGLFADYEGKRVYFCCKECPEQFKKTPAKFIEKSESQGVTLEKAGAPQTTCPVMGGKIDKSVYTDHQGKRVYFCCKGCIAQFQKDPAKFLKTLAEGGVTLEATPAAAPAKRPKRPVSHEGHRH